MILDILQHTITITMFVLVMMLLIEYITVQSRGKWGALFERSSWFQIVFAAIMGIIPGCLGGFIVVTLYAHQIVSFAALITVMIATFGDEAFVMFSMIPGKAALLSVVIFAIAGLAGFITNLFAKNKTLMVLPENYLKFHHSNPECLCFNSSLIIPQLKKITFHRTLLITICMLFMLFLIKEGVNSGLWNWKRITFMIVTSIGLFIVATVPDHFLSEHLWKHTIKKHIPGIFLWTFGAFTIMHGMEHLFDIKELVYNNMHIVLIIAVLIGIIPESGPHIVFITLFANGTIPFSVLLASSIVQDGHAAVPLLAESPKSFIVMKIVNVLIGLFVGLIGLYFGL